MPENRDEEKNHCWSLKDIPKFEGKGEQPFSHLMEFEDYLIASGVEWSQKKIMLEEELR